MARFCRLAAQGTTPPQIPRRHFVFHHSAATKKKAKGRHTRARLCWGARPWVPEPPGVSRSMAIGWPVFGAVGSERALVDTDILHGLALRLVIIQSSLPRPSRIAASFLAAYEGFRVPAYHRGRSRFHTPARRNLQSRAHGADKAAGAALCVGKRPRTHRSHIWAPFKNHRRFLCTPKGNGRGSEMRLAAALPLRGPPSAPNPRHWGAEPQGRRGAAAQRILRSKPFPGWFLGAPPALQHLVGTVNRLWGFHGAGSSPRVARPPLGCLLGCQWRPRLTSIARHPGPSGM